MSLQTTMVTLHPDAQGGMGFIKAASKSSGDTNNVMRVNGFFGGTPAQRQAGSPLSAITPMTGSATYQQIRDFMVRQGEFANGTPFLLHAYDEINWGVAWIRNPRTATEEIVFYPTPQWIID